MHGITCRLLFSREAARAGAIGGIRNHPSDNKACRDWKVVNSAPDMITTTRFPGTLNDKPSLTRGYTRDEQSAGQSHEIKDLYARDEARSCSRKFHPRLSKRSSSEIADKRHFCIRDFV